MQNTIKKLMLSKAIVQQPPTIILHAPLHKTAWTVNVGIQQSPAVTLPPVTLLLQLHYVELGPIKLELSYFLVFFPVPLFSSFFPQLQCLLCFRGKKQCNWRENTKKLSLIFFGLNRAGHLLHNANPELHYFGSYTILKQHRIFTT